VRQRGEGIVTTRTITDPWGALWPVTGHWCDGCGMPLWTDDPSGLHPNCTPGAPFTDSEHRHLVTALAEQLGATPVQPAEIGRWRRSGNPVIRR